MGRLDVVRLCAALLALIAPLAPPAGPAQAQAAPAARYKTFSTSIYVVVDATRRLADPAVFAREYARVTSQVKFDKVYVEVYRDHQFATDAEIEAVKHEFEAKGVTVYGGMTLAAGGAGGQFGTFDYQLPADRAECQQAAELAARHFDHVIMDDFFFYASKSDADIAAKGARSWTQYRLDTMREVAADLVLAPARAVNPNVKITIKYPNWHEHFQGLGFDLDKEAKLFDSIYAGTETRDPEITDQLLQQYESYEIIRYYSHIRPGASGGGWVDTYDSTYADRYAEQLWDTLLAKAPEITLFNWTAMASPRAAPAGTREAWAGLSTSFSWDKMLAGYHASAPSDLGPGWASIAGAALARIDDDLAALGGPIGVASYKPYQSSGEDFLQNYLGDIGLPIEMTPIYPAEAKTVLLTQEASFDPDIVAKIKASLQAGHSVVITSGFLKAMQDKGIEDIVEWKATGNVAAIHDFINGYGAGAGAPLNDPAHDNPPVLFPEIRFWTNDSWPIIRGVASAKGFPIVLMDHYSKGVIYLLNIPENQGDLYNLPQGVLTQIKRYIQADFPVRIESQSRVALFAYDNDAFVVESYRATPEPVIIALPGAGRRLRDLSTGEAVPALAPVVDPHPRRADLARPETRFAVTVAPHSYQVFKLETGAAAP